MNFLGGQGLILSKISGQVYRLLPLGYSACFFAMVFSVDVSQFKDAV